MQHRSCSLSYRKVSLLSSAQFFSRLVSSSSFFWDWNWSPAISLCCRRAEWRGGAKCLKGARIMGGGVSGKIFFGCFFWGSFFFCFFTCAPATRVLVSHPVQKRRDNKKYGY